MNTTMKVFLACALGAFVGAFVALEGNHYFWWFGLLVGGLVGYLTYEIKEVARALPVAWQKARGWQPDREWWQVYLKGVGIYIGSVFTLMTPPLLFLLWFSFGGFIEGRASSLEMITATAGLVFLFLLMGIYFGLTLQTTSGTDIKSLQKEQAEFQKFANPFRIYFWFLPRWTLKGGWWLLLSLLKLLEQSPRFVATALWVFIASAIVVAKLAYFLLKEVHSDIRMLCGVDAAIGTIIGYFAGSAVIGALAGGAWGALNFEILSIRVLKLVPAEHSLLRRF